MKKDVWEEIAGKKIKLEEETTPTPPAGQHRTLDIMSNRDVKEIGSAKADFQLIHPVGRISNDWHTYPPGTGRPPTTLTAFCVDEKGGRHSDEDKNKILAIGRKRKKDETIFRIELYTKIGQPYVSTRDIKDAFAGGAMCFLNPSIICYASWNISSGSPLIRLFNSEKSDLGPSLHTQNFLRKKTSQRYPGGFFQNFKGITPFVLDESDVHSTELKLTPHVMAWSMEGLVCIWELTCVTACVRTGRLKFESPSRHGLKSRMARQMTGRMNTKSKVSDAGALRRLESFPKDVRTDENMLDYRNRILGGTISQCGTKVIVVDRYWRIWIWFWKTNVYQCIGLANKLKEMTPYKGSPSLPKATFRNSHSDIKSEPNIMVEAENPSPDSTIWDDIPKTDWLLKPKQLSIVYSDETNTLIIGTKVGVQDDEKSKIEGAVEIGGSLWPPGWQECDWLISINLDRQEIIEVQEAWRPVRGPGKFIFALTDRDVDPALDSATKKRGKRGLLLLRATDLCVVADSRTQSSFDKINIRELETASCPPVGSEDNSKYFELQRRQTLQREDLDEKSNGWSFNPFSKPRAGINDKIYTAFSLYCFDGMGNGALVGAFGT